MEFWGKEVTDASWKTLLQLNKKVKFVLIGGWAVYLYTHLEKSKDIDIVVDYDALKLIADTYDLHKNQKLSKYEVKTERFDIDIYVPHYSKLTVPPEDIINMTRSVEGFVLPIPEILLILKLGAFIDRRDSIKGQKDTVDILGLLLYSDLDTKLLKNLCDRYVVDYRLIKTIIKDADEDTLGYLGTNRHYFSKAKKQLLSQF